MNNPTRRNRNIGTTKSGHGQNNRFSVPNSGSLQGTIEHQLVEGTHYLIEATKDGYSYAIDMAEVERCLKELPSDDLNGLKFVIFHQPSMKAEKLSPNWAQYWPRFTWGCISGPAIVLSAISPDLKTRWPKSLRVEDRRELDQLRLEGHLITEGPRYYEIISSIEAVKRTQLNRSLLHEVGHHVAARRGIGPQQSESFAQAYERKLAKLVEPKG